MKPARSAKPPAPAAVAGKPAATTRPVSQTAPRLGAAKEGEELLGEND
ncbi:MAG: hypothetical protein LLG01_11305 [Planctomycetaceae bacterium]|nr:hypothetical protein [Planctomycetaceae bacterium]